MVYDYLITLKKPDYKLVDQVSQLMYIFSLAAFAFFYYNYPKSGIIYPIVGLGMLLTWAYVLKKKRNTGQGFFRLGFLFAAIGWFLGPEHNFWMGLLYTVAALLERQVKFPQEIGFSADEISFNSFPRKVLKWNQLNNVVIKDGLITLDQKDNKLFQKEIEGDVTADIEKEFNDFCRRHIESDTNKTI